MRSSLLPALFILLKVMLASFNVLLAGESDRIRVWPDNPYYLAWGDTPVFLLGATAYHSWTPISRPLTVDYSDQLTRLDSVIREIGSPHLLGFVRCLPYDPMNHMHDGAVEKVLQPWLKLEDGRYDLERFENDWELRLKAYLELAAKLKIIVSIEIWDDWSVTRGPGGAYNPGADAAWNAHPFNPGNNINYDEDVLPAHTDVCGAPFYRTIPAHHHNEMVLTLQKKYVDHLLKIISIYPNILINISNESRADLEWSKYWAKYLRDRIPSHIMIGEMPSTNRINFNGECDANFHPLTLCTDHQYDYIDVSQAVSAHELTDVRQQALLGSRYIHQCRQTMDEAGARRPVVISKDYTRDPGGGDIVLWSRFIAGAASARFHRLSATQPASVSDFQHQAIGRLGKFIAEIPFWSMQPLKDDIMSLPPGSGANILANPGNIYIIQILGGTENETFSIQLTKAAWEINWIDPESGKIIEKHQIKSKFRQTKFQLKGDSEHRILSIKKAESKKK